MSWVDKLTARTWSILVIGMLAFAISGCEGDTGPQGPAGQDGQDGQDGADAPVPDGVDVAIANADAESCGTCHQGAGDMHQAVYDMYEGSDLTLEITDLDSVENAGVWDLTVYFTVTKDGAPLDDINAIPQKRFISVNYDGAGQYFQGGGPYFGNWAAGAGPGEFTATAAGKSFDPTVNGMVYGYIADEEFTPGDVVPGKHINLYDNVASAAIAFGSAQAGDPDAYQTAAISDGCTQCHGSPYMKHGFRVAEVEGIPSFAACKTCHYDDRTGGHEDWQYMVDDPFNWATGVGATRDYAYIANVMNDTHMAHAMEFPYPQSMSNCNTCHEGYLTEILDDSNFDLAFCKSCHVIEGTDAWPADAGTTMEGMYAQPQRPPPMTFLWADAGVDNIHNVDMNCQNCHGTDGFSGFADMHSGYDDHIYDENGVKFADMYPVVIDSITMAGDLMTIEFSSDPAVVPEVLVSFYGWDTKNFIVGSHERDANDACQGRSPGCKMEYVPESAGGSANPLFVENAGSVLGDWSVTLDTSALQLYKTDSIPEMIADGRIHKAEVSITPELEVDGEDVVLLAVGETYDITGSMIIDDYFKGANAAVDVDKCNACHDSLASTFHDGSGRGGDGIEVCKHCHTTTFPGSHIELASRAIDSYVHAIHSFQPFDEDDVYNANDPVFNARNDQHKHHTFPYFTALACEACHMEGAFNVPDQSKSLFGVLRASWTLADPSVRAIGTIPEDVTGPASRACGGCHRADMVNADAAGDLASFNAHTGSFGTLEENDDDDAILFGVIDKIMSMFE